MTSAPKSSVPELSWTHQLYKQQAFTTSTMHIRSICQAVSGGALPRPHTARPHRCKHKVRKPPHDNWFFVEIIVRANEKQSDYHYQPMETTFWTVINKERRFMTQWKMLNTKRPNRIAFYSYISPSSVFYGCDFPSKYPKLSSEYCLIREFWRS